MAPGAGGDTPGAKVETGSIKWQRDDEVPTCENCNIEFSFTVRRHHCRACGRIFCATCSSEKLDIVNYNTPQRVCFTCYSRYCDLRPDEKMMVEEVANEMEDKLIYSALVLKVDSVGNRSRAILVVCKFRILCIKRGSKKQLLSVQHLLDLAKISVPRTGRMALVFGKQSNETVVSIYESDRIPNAIQAIRSNHARMTMGFPASYDIQLDVPEQFLLPIDSQTSASASGFVDIYQALCSYFKVKSSYELVQYIYDTVSLGTMELDFTNCPGAEPDTPITFDLAPVFAALRHNTYFYSINMNGIIRSSSFTLLANTMQTNVHLTKLTLSNLGKISGVQKLGEALAKNSANALQVLDLSGTVVNDKAMAALAGAIAVKEYGLQTLLLARSNVSVKGLAMLVRDGFERNPGVALTLQHLSLSFNSFDESSSALLQAWFSRMSEYSNLRQLELEKCGLHLVYVTRPLHSFVKLRHLDVSGNRIDTGTCQLLCTIAELTSTLTTYNLAGCSLTADGAVAIVKCIVSNQRLSNTRIDLSGNSLNARAIESLARVLVAHNTNLAGLDLSRNQLTDDGVLSLCAALQKMPHSGLEVLVLNEASLNVSSTSGAHVAQAIVATLNTVPSIKSLSLCGGWPLAVAVPLLHLMHTNHSLLELRIEENKLGDAGAAAIATMLRTNQTLGKLCIDGNAIGISGWHAIRSAFLHNRTLQVLEFAWVDLAKTLSPLPISKRSLARNDLIEIQYATRINQHLAGGLAERFRPLKHSAPTTRLPPCPVPESMLQYTGPVDLTPSTDTTTVRPDSVIVDAGVAATAAAPPSTKAAPSSPPPPTKTSSSSSSSTTKTTTTTSKSTYNTVVSPRQTSTQQLPPEPAYQPPPPPIPQQQQQYQQPQPTQQYLPTQPPAGPLHNSTNNVVILTTGLSPNAAVASRSIYEHQGSSQYTAQPPADYHTSPYMPQPAAVPDGYFQQQQQQQQQQQPQYQPVPPTSLYANTSVPLDPYASPYAGGIDYSAMEPQPPPISAFQPSLKNDAYSQRAYTNSASQRSYEAVEPYSFGATASSSAAGDSAPPSAYSSTYSSADPYASWPTQPPPAPPTAAAPVAPAPAPPPPPAAPAAPPPLHSKAPNSSSRAALLQAIENRTTIKLKPTVTNDRSAPKV